MCYKCSRGPRGSGTSQVARMELKWKECGRGSEKDWRRKSQRRGFVVCLCATPRSVGRSPSAAGLSPTATLSLFFGRREVLPWNGVELASEAALATEQYGAQGPTTVVFGTRAHALRFLSVSKRALSGCFQSVSTVVRRGAHPLTLVLFSLALYLSLRTLIQSPYKL